MRCTRLLAVLVCAFSTSAFAAQHPNLVKGFQANGVYQVNGIDTINALNGNLTMTIPIGPAFNIGGGMTYQLRLHSNVNFWDAAERIDLDGVPNGPCQNSHEVACMHAFPDRRANAGLGWTVSVGRLFPAGDAWRYANSGDAWVYESPDGADHEFRWNTLPPNAEAPNVLYDRQSYLRLRKVGNKYELDFPNGEVHTFKPNDDPTTADDDDEALWSPYLLESITNQFGGNRLEIAYERVAPGGAINRWTLNDGFRQQVIHFESKLFESGVETSPALINERMLVSRIEVAAFGGTTGTYTLGYAPHMLSRPNWHNIKTEYVSADARVQFLTSIALPDGTSYSVEYDSFKGLPLKLTLPTGGRIAWTWGQYAFPYVTADTRTYARFSDGVTSRSIYDRGKTTPEGTWNYATTPVTGGYVTTITDPLGNRSKQYFNVYALPYTDPPAPAPDDYSKPFLPTQSVALSPPATGSVFLTEEFLPAGASARTRSKYLRFESSYRHVEATRNTYHDDGESYLDTENSNLDGYGHFGTTVTAGTGAPARTTTTTYRGGAIGASQPWITGLFGSVRVSESGLVNVSEYHHAATGFLERKRLIKDTETGARGSNDVIVAYTADSRGNVVTEEYYGGDFGSVETKALGEVALSTPVYRMVYDYAGGSGSLLKSSYEKTGQQTVTNFSADADTTGLIKAVRDSSGLETKYEYDAMGRLTWVKPPGRAATKYSYPNFSTSNDIKVEQFPQGTTTGSLTEVKHTVDGLGRVTHETIRTAKATATEPAKYSRRDTLYNAMGWTTEVSELVDSTTTDPPATVFTHDAFGRVLTTTLPDLSVLSNTYQGARTRTRTSSVSMAAGSNGVPVTLTEKYDLYGRLVSVTEASGPTSAGSPVGGNVTTEYGYGPGGQLLTVQMTGSGGVAQSRSFDYDGRGFLRWESHPESGVTAYTYDARGNVGSKSPGAANSQFDLVYEYDHAERLISVKGRNPFYGQSSQPQWRVLKSFEYAYENALSPAPADYRKGKLLTAARYNYDPSVASGFTYKVAETYQYRDGAGRKTNRRTHITRGDDQNEAYWWSYRTVDTAVTYDDLDLPVSIDYPKCIDCALPHAKVQTFTYDHGRLKTVPGYVSDVTYHPNLMWSVISHSNGVNDIQELDPSGMARPYRLKSETWNSCRLPKIVSHPVGRLLTTANPSVTLTVGLSQDSGLVSYQWRNVDTGELVGTSETYTAQPSATTRYTVTVSNTCHSITSNVAVVTVNECVLPGEGELGASNDRNSDGTFTLSTSSRGTQPLTYTWVRTSDGATVGTSQSVTLAAPAVTTTYTVTVSNVCGTATASTTVEPPLTMTATGFDAVWAGGTQVNLSWPASPHAAKYFIERRSGPEWVALGTSTTASYVDSTVAASRTYAYRVQASDAAGVNRSPYSNAAVATTRTFAQVSPNTYFNATSVAPMLEAVNSVRGAVGWPAVTWAQILPTSDGPPVITNSILASHVLTCRARMNEALHSLGVVAGAYSDGNLYGVLPKAAHINDVTGRAQ